jgi:hypothetical protein
MMMRRPLLLAAVLALMVTVLPAHASPFEPPRERWHAENDTGHWSRGADRVRIDAGCTDLAGDAALACSLEALRTKPQVVIAFVDTGINPYHRDFRAPELVHHPSTYLTGFPSDAEAIPLSLDVADDRGYAAARAADDARWQGLARNRLYWVPGTRVVGARSFAAGGSGGGLPERVILDDTGHGTGVASVAAGQRFGANPDALIVVVEGLGTAGLRWAAEQPWIDIVSNSWGPGLPGRVDPLGDVSATRASTRRGQTVLFSSGNGLRNTNSSDALPAAVDPCRCKIPGHNLSASSYTSGPSWIITVGAASPINGQAHWWHGVPVDVASFGSKWAAAAHNGVTFDDKRDFGGTSCATPITAGVLSAVVQEARGLLGDPANGQRAGEPGVIARAAEGVTLPASGPLADGVLTQAESRAVVERSAQPVAFDPEKATWDYAITPTTDQYWLHQGYGLVDRDAKERALDVVAGVAELPGREDVAAWQARMDQLRDAVYGAP